MPVALTRRHEKSAGVTLRNAEDLDFCGSILKTRLELVPRSLAYREITCPMD